MKYVGKIKDLPCRVACSLEGFECFIYNNAPAYDRMKDVLGLSTTDDTSVEQEKVTDVRGTLDPESQTPVHVDTSLMERLMPFQLEVTTGAVMIGNTELKSMIVATASEASGTYSITKSRSAMDHYKSVFDFVLRKVQINLKDNMDYTNVEKERVPRPLKRHK